MTSTLSDAIILATMKHYKQTDKGGHPYILHPLRVMLKASNDEERMVAVLHDVVEDSDMTLTDLKKLGYNDIVIDAIDHLTKRKGESYDSFIERVKLNPLATKVKLWDIEDNSDLSRLSKITDVDWDRMKKYSKAVYKLTDGKRYQ